jgi:hypothetical protein
MSFRVIFISVTKVTGISLRSERPLSVVFPLFLEWLSTINDATNILVGWYNGIM